MKKMLSTVLMMLSLALVLTSCGKEAATPVAPTVTEEPAAVETELEDTLIIYSTHSESLLELVADAFTEKTGVAVEFINLQAELSDRVRAESANPQADIMFGGASSLFMQMTE